MLGLGFSLSVTISSGESCGGNGGSLSLPLVNIGDACITEFTGYANTFSISRMSYESWIDTMFVELDGMGWFDLV